MDHGAHWARQRVVYRSLRLDRVPRLAAMALQNQQGMRDRIAWQKVGGGVGDVAAILFVAAIFETGLRREGRSQHPGLR